MNRSQESGGTESGGPNRIAKLYQHIARQREDFHYKIAHKLVKEYDLIAVVDAERRGEGRP
ncbi:MAG: hypothetical protein QNJ74_02175 [Trichodesmium sp. MO_231.B1]|nr:hypothetical protein [Trichodesmium sp. MO_231.B1]